MTTVSEECRAELAGLFPLGGVLTITDPLPTHGEITEHGEHGLKLSRDGRTCAFVSWALLSTARVQRHLTIEAVE